MDLGVLVISSLTSRNVAQFVNNTCLSVLNHKLLCPKVVSLLLHDFSPCRLPLEPECLVLEHCPIEVNYP